MYNWNKTKQNSIQMSSQSPHSYTNISESKVHSAAVLFDMRVYIPHMCICWAHNMWLLFAKRSANAFANKRVEYLHVLHFVLCHPEHRTCTIQNADAIFVNLHMSDVNPEQSPVHNFEGHCSWIYGCYYPLTQRTSNRILSQVAISQLNTDVGNVFVICTDLHVCQQTCSIFTQLAEDHP